MPKNKICPIHGKFQTQCGCTTKQITAATKKALQRPDVGCSAWLGALAKELRAQGSRHLDMGISQKDEPHMPTTDSDREQQWNRGASPASAPAGGWTNWGRDLAAHWPEGLAMLASALFVELHLPVAWLWLILWALFSKARNSSNVPISHAVKDEAK